MALPPTYCCTIVESVREGVIIFDLEKTVIYANPAAETITGFSAEAMIGRKCFDYDELMESEFGRSMHELRVLRLRQRHAYSGPIAQNAGYLIEYLLAIASSPTVDVKESPIKMYGRYLPETIAIF